MMTRSPMFACTAPSSFPCFMLMIYLVLPVRQSQRSYGGVGARVTGWQRVGGARRLELPTSRKRVVAREAPWLGTFGPAAYVAVVGPWSQSRSEWTWMLRLPSRYSLDQTELSPRTVRGGKRRFGGTDEARWSRIGGRVV
jgi:hypothetical protein